MECGANLLLQLLARTKAFYNDGGCDIYRSKPPFQFRVWASLIIKSGWIIAQPQSQFEGEHLISFTDGNLKTRHVRTSDKGVWITLKIGWSNSDILTASVP